MATVDLDNEFLELFYNITNTEIPANIDLFALKKQLVKIVDTMKELNKNEKKVPQVKSVEGIDVQEDDSNSLPRLLIVDDLGVITYQLKVLLSDFEVEIDCSQEIYDAVNKFKTKRYDYVIMDLFIPTEREGSILLIELKKMALAAGKSTVIGVITASPRKEIEQQCKSRGADFFLEKNNDWQNQLRNIIDSYLNAGKDDENW